MVCGFGPDGPQLPARGEGFKQFVSGVTGIGYNLFCPPWVVNAEQGGSQRARAWWWDALCWTTGTEPGNKNTHIIEICKLSTFMYFISTKQYN